MNVARCSRRGCGTILTERHDRTFGRIALICEPCERNSRGLCRDCPSKLPKRRALRCASCALRRRREVWRDVSRRQRADDAKRERILAGRRRRYRSDPEVRRKALEENRRYRAAKPTKRDDGDRLYHRVKMREYRQTNPRIKERSREQRRERYAKDPVYREHILERQRERRRQQIERQRQAVAA